MLLLSAVAAVAAGTLMAHGAYGAASAGGESPPQVPHPEYIDPIILEARFMLNLSELAARVFGS